MAHGRLQVVQIMKKGNTYELSNKVEWYNHSTYYIVYFNTHKHKLIHIAKYFTILQ